MIKSEKTFQIALFNINDASAAGEVFRDPALGLGYIKSYFDKYSALKAGAEVTILKNNIWENLIKLDPKIIGISSTTQDYTNAIHYARKIRQSGSRALISIGGIHISNLPESFSEAFDLGIIGEGELTFNELAESVYDYGFDKQRLPGIAGLIFKEGGKLVATNKRALIENLDIVPPPFRNYLKLYAYPHMLTSRGCPFRCAYCSSTAFWGNKVRFHSPPRVLEELLELARVYKARHICIADDLFSINKKRLEGIIELIKQHKRLFKSVTFSVLARPNVVDAQLCQLFKEMNVVRVSLGIESGSDKMLKLLNRGLTKEDNYRAIRLLKKYKFIVNGVFIVGSPDETADDIEETYKFVRASGLDGGGIGLAQAFPNTVFWNDALKRGLVSNDMDFSKLKFIRDPRLLANSADFILLSKYLDKESFILQALKIKNIFARKNFRAIFLYENLKFSNIIMMLKKPEEILRFIIVTLKGFLRYAFS